MFKCKVLISSSLMRDYYGLSMLAIYAEFSDKKFNCFIDDQVRNICTCCSCIEIGHIVILSVLTLYLNSNCIKICSHREVIC